MTKSDNASRAVLLRRAEVSVTIAVFVTVFATSGRLARLPLRALIKDDLGLPPEAMAEFFAVVGVAWYVKPIAAVISDQIPLGGTRRKHYMMLSALAGAATWVAAAFVPFRLELLMLALAVVNVAAVVGNSVTGGLLVDAGREHRATGRLSALRVIAMNTGSLIVGPLGGWLASRVFPLTCAVGAGLMLALAMIVGIFLRAEVSAPAPPKLEVLERLGDAVAQFRLRRIWSVAIVTGLFYLAPSYQSLFYYYQRDALQFSDQTIGLMASLNCLGGMLGAYIYLRNSSKFPLRKLLVAGMFLCGSCSLTYLLYDSLTAALILEPIAGFCFLLGVLPVQELTARASPPKHEAFGLAAILSVGNAAIAMSDVIGTRLAATFALDVRDLIVINAATVLLPLLLLPIVPDSLLGRE